MASPSVISSVAKWKEFLTRYYKEQIHQLAVSDAKNKALLVNFPDITKFDVRLSEELVINPDLVLAHAEDALTLIDLPVKTSIEARIRIVKNPKHIQIGDLEPRMVNTLVSVDATVQNILQAKPRVLEAAFECARCKNVIYIPQEGAGKFIEPSYCQCNEEKKGVFRLLYQESRFEDYQRIRVQAKAAAGKPPELDGNLTNDLVGTVSPGDHITITGLLRSAQEIKREVKQATFEYYLDTISVEKEQVDFEDFEITPDEEKQIRTYAAEEGSAEKFASCIAPWIYGRGMIKLAATAHLFGGVRREISPGKFKRGSIHVLCIGDAGGGRSDILEDLSKIAPRGWYGSGSGISGVGLTAAVVPDDFGGDKYTLRAGVLPLYSYAYIDEVGRIPPKEIEKLHTGMEQQRVDIAKGGFNTSIQAICSIFAAGNPKNGRWDEYEDMAEQIGLDAALMNRFALIILTRDTPEEAMEHKVARQALAEYEEYETPYPRELLGKWIVLAQRKCSPTVPDEIKDMLENYYVDLRMGRVGDELKIIHPTPRQLEDARRLAEAFAKMQFSDVVKPVHVELALKLLTESIQGAAQGNADYINVGTDTAMAARRKRILDTVSELCVDGEIGKVTIIQVVDACAAVGLDRTRTERDLRHMITDKALWSPEPGFVAVSR